MQSVASGKGPVSKNDVTTNSDQAAAPASTGRNSDSRTDASLLTRESISVSEIGKAVKSVRRRFPGPAHAESALRVALDRRAQAELVAHAKESLNVEVCGVLVGEVCEDEEGLFVHVQAVIRGAAAAEASTHVTFTQATWNSIHQVLDRDYPKLRIVGWYHTHPGFGVEFSEMDLFIHKNFFSGPAQIALVTDPLSGAVAICLNTSSGARYLPRFWVDGREQPCQVPARQGPRDEAEPKGSGASPEQAIRDLETRVNQLVRALDENQAFHYRFLLFCGTIFCLAVLGTAGYLVFHAYTSKYEPPKINSYVPVPVQIGDKTALIGLAVVDWQLPDEINTLKVLEADLLKKIAAESAKQTAAKGGTNSTPNALPPDKDPKQQKK